MFDRARSFLSALLIVSFCVAGCGEDKSADTSSDEGTASAGQDDAETTEAESTPDAPPADSAQETKPAVTAASDVPMPNEIIPDSTVKFDWLSYNSKQKPAELAAFYQKEFPAKGWTLGRNDSAPLAMKTLTGVVQEYRKGANVHTVVLTEQIGSDANYTMVMVLDIPLPPKTSQVVAFGQQAVIETPEPPPAAIDWFTKNLAPLGWTVAGAPQDLGGATTVNFKKDKRTISATVRANPQTKGSGVILNHQMGYAA